MKSGCLFIKALFLRFMLRNGELGETRPGQNQISVFHHDLENIRMLLTVVGVFFFCWLPLSITILSLFYNPNTFNGWSNRSYNIYKGVVWQLPLINSLWNPIIYACLDQTYREAFKHLFQKMCRTISNTQQPPAMIELRPLRNN